MEKYRTLRSMYPTGTKIRLIQMNDSLNPVPPGTIGEVVYVDDMGTIQMVWENGSTLGLIVDEDEFEIVEEA